MGMRAHAACVHARTWPLTRGSEGHACLLGGYFCVAFSVFAGINVIFDESLGISTELRTAYAVFIILSLVAAAVAFAYRIIAAPSMRRVRGALPKQLTCASAIVSTQAGPTFPAWHACAGCWIILPHKSAPVKSAPGKSARGGQRSHSGSHSGDSQAPMGARRDPTRTGPLRYHVPHPLC